MHKLFQSINNKKMKIYTEKQVKKLFKDNTFLRNDTINGICKTLQPIELPSDEEIEKFIEKGEIGYHDPEWDYPYGVGVTQAIEWVINHIKQQDNDN